jgi:hypothetical protein
MGRQVAMRGSSVHIAMRVDITDANDDDIRVEAS